MSTPLRVLIVEDSPADAALVIRELKTAGFAADWRVAATESEYLAALGTTFDVILAAYNLPDMNALQALRYRDERHVTTPLIVVTGHLGDEAAVECIRRGAIDYLLKDGLKRLGPAVTRALKERRQIERLELEARRNRQLELKIEAALRNANAALERRVEERTQALLETNDSLRHAIAERQKAEIDLLRARRLEQEKNAALAQTIAALGESEARFREFTDLASDWYWEQDAELRFTEIGASYPVGAEDGSSLIGKLRWEANDTSREPNKWERHRQTLLSHQPFHDFRFKRTDENGRGYHLSVSGKPLLDQTGTFIGYRGIGRDITAQIQTEQELHCAKEEAEGTKELLQDAIDSVVDGFVISDADGRQIVCNEGYRRLFAYQTGSPWAPGCTTVELLRQGLSCGRYPEAVGREPDWLDKALRQLREVVPSTERLLDDGRWMLLTRHSMSNGGIAIALTDITEQKQAQADLLRTVAALRESETRFREFSDLASDWYWEQDKELRFTSSGASGRWLSNARARDKVDPIGKLRWELNDTSRDPKHWENHRQTVLAHKPFRDFCFEQVDEQDHLRHVSISGIPVHDETGVFVGYRGIGRDITEQVETEKRLRRAAEMGRHLAESEQKFRTLAEIAPNAFIIVDSFGKVVFWNRAAERIFGYAQDDAVGKEVHRLLAPERFHGNAADGIAKFVTSGIGPSIGPRYETTAVRKDGVAISIELSIASCRVNDQWHAIGIAQDVSPRKAAEEALRRSESSLERAQEIGKIGSWELDIASGEFTWSKNLYCMRGYPADFRPNIRNLGSRMNPADLQPLLDWYADLAAGRTCGPIEIRTITPDGKETANINEARAVPDADGVIRRIAGTSQDITAFKQVRNALRESQARLERAQEIARLGSWEMNLVSGELVWSKEFYRLTGFPFDAKPSFALLDSTLEPADVQLMRKWLASTMAGTKCDPVEIKITNPDGEKWVGRIEGRAVADPDGIIRYVMGTAQDITPLTQAQAALRRSEAHLDLAQEIARIGSWELDVTKRKFIWSKELYRRGEFSPDVEATIELMRSRLRSADVRPMMEWLADLQAGRKRDALELKITNPDGSEWVNRLEGRAIADPDGVIWRIVGTSQDVTELRRIESVLAQSQKMDALGHLTGGMAHDFNNILGVIIGNLDLLKPLLCVDPLASDLCAEAKEGASRCADLIKRLLAFARRQPLRPDTADVNALVRDIYRLLDRTLGEQVQLTLHLDASTWPVNVDGSQLEAALINIATNARDAMPKGGHLSICTRNANLDALYAAQHFDVKTGDYVLIEMCDTGAGMPPEVIGRIFEPFFTTKAHGHGTGLGLAMVFGFVKQSGGHVSVYSELGLGTKFRIYLPRSDGLQATTSHRSATDEILGGDETILLVEDNNQLRRAAERQLSGLGYTVRVADSALPAIEILSGEEKVDLLFSDVVMPGTMDGLDLAYQAQQLRSGLKVLLTSGFVGAEGVDRRMAESPFCLLSKPYSLKEVSLVIRTVLDKVATM